MHVGCGVSGLYRVAVCSCCWCWHIDSLVYCFYPRGVIYVCIYIFISVKIHRVVFPRCKAVLRGHSDAVWAVSWSPRADGARLASASQDGTVINIWGAC